VLPPFRGGGGGGGRGEGGIVCLSDTDSYAGGSFYTPVSTSQTSRVEG